MSDGSSKKVYEAVVGRVEHCTGGQQLPLATETAVVSNVCRRFRDDEDVHPADVRSAISKARHNGDLVRWVHPETETARLGIDDAEVLEEKIESYVKRTDRVTEASARVLRIARQRIDELEGDTDE